MSPKIHIRKRDKCDQWLAIDMRDSEVGASVVIPAFGPDHNAGLDCWCQPAVDDGVIVHRECH